MTGKLYKLPQMNEIEIRIIYNSLKLFHGDYPESYKGSLIWQKEIEKIMIRFPQELTWLSKKELHDSKESTL
jgi:hypothetical protein